jgi:hypothetical protein
MDSAKQMTDEIISVFSINELQSFTFAQTKWKKRKIQRCKCKTQIKRQANQKGGE